MQNGSLGDRSSSPTVHTRDGSKATIAVHTSHDSDGNEIQHAVEPERKSVDKRRRGTGMPPAAAIGRAQSGIMPRLTFPRGSRGSRRDSGTDGSALPRRPSMMSQTKNTMSFAAGHLAKDIVHVNTGTRGLDLIQRLIYGSPILVLSMSFFMYMLSVFSFAAIFYAFGDDCYKFDDDFSFATVLWMSLHAFSTIGFGNIAPLQTCVGAQVVLLIESFVSVLVVSAIGGYVVKQFLRPISAVRFSTCVLINQGRRRIQNDDDDERNHSLRESHGIYKFITFRMVRQGRVQLRDVRVHVQAQWWNAGTTAFGDRDSHKGRVASLALEQSYFTNLEQLQVWHRIDESSPLWRMRDNLKHVLDGIEVSVSAFDMASLQQVMMYTRYERSHLIVDAVFENTLTPSGNKHNPEQLQADHSKLDIFLPEEGDHHTKLMRAKNARQRGSIPFIGRRKISNDESNIMEVVEKPTGSRFYARKVTASEESFSYGVRRVVRRQPSRDGLMGSAPVIGGTPMVV